MARRIIVDALSEAACPHCGKAFALQDAITHQLIEHYEAEYDALLDGERRQMRESAASDAERDVSRRFADQVAGLEARLADSLAEQARAKTRLEQAVQQAVERARADGADKTLAMQAELAAKDERLAGYRESELALRKEKALLEEREKALKLEVQRQVDSERKLAEEEAAKAFRLREAEWRKKIDDAQKANDELKRKLEQGSQQLQGEVLELELEDLLREAFRFDVIEPVRKGARGADLIQTVRQRSGQVCGKIVWETKRAENWSSAWIGKLKDDQRAVGGELAVLVSTAFPADVSDPMVLHEGIWLVRPELVRALAEALRMLLVESQRQRAISAGVGESMEALYAYVTSAQFAHKIRAVVETYQQMRDDLDKEKAAMTRIWKKREAQIERASANMLGLCGELQGVSSDALPQLDDIGLLPS